MPMGMNLGSVKFYVHLAELESWVLHQEHSWDPVNSGRHEFCFAVRVW